LRNDSALQDILRLLTLWFKFGAHEDVSHAMCSGFTSVEVDTWLEVIPQVKISLTYESYLDCLSLQIIARIQTPSVNIRRTINLLLTDVGKHHPQALIYPLTVASKSSSAARKNAAIDIMNRMKEHSAAIVEQVSRMIAHRFARLT
jgi:serine/threonine-protein kinase mTOR